MQASRKRSKLLFYCKSGWLDVKHSNRKFVICFVINQGFITIKYNSYVMFIFGSHRVTKNGDVSFRDGFTSFIKVDLLCEKFDQMCIQL